MKDDGFSSTWFAAKVIETHLEVLAHLDEVLVEHVVERRVQLFLHVLDDERLPVGERVLEMLPEVLVVQGGELRKR